MQYRQKKSLSTRVTRTIAITVALILLGFCAAAICFDAIFLDKKLNNRLATAGRLAQVTLPHPLWNLDDTALADLLDVIFLDRQIVFLSLQGSRGNIGTRVRLWARGKSMESFDNPFFYLGQIFPIIHNGANIASISVVFSRKAMFRQLAVDFSILLLLGLFLGITIIFRAIRLTKTHIFSPLQGLEESAAAITAGEMTTPVEKPSDDEIGRLALSFDHMRQSVRDLVEKLKMANAALESHNLLLEQKVAERTSELEEKNRELARTLTQVEEANTKIVESLHYAKRIQFSLLPRMERVTECLPECFIIWEPRDIVGGDFFFVHRFDEGIFVAVVDCTGHGVPGALMSMVAASSLRTILFTEQCHTDPAQVLMRLNVLVRAFLKQDTDQAHSDDGLDAAVCFINNNTGELLFSGARMPLFHLRRGTAKCIKGDRRSVGYRNSDVFFAFTNHAIPLLHDDAFYLVSDGFYDQLGGDKRVPFGYKRFRSLVEKTAGTPVSGQRELFLEAFHGHSGGHDILDDVTLFAFSCAGHSRGMEKAI